MRNSQEQKNMESKQQMLYGIIQENKKNQELKHYLGKQEVTTKSNFKPQV